MSVAIRRWPHAIDLILITYHTLAQRTITDVAYNSYCIYLLNYLAVLQLYKRVIRDVIAVSGVFLLYNASLIASSTYIKILVGI